MPLDLAPLIAMMELAAASGLVRFDVASNGRRVQVQRHAVPAPAAVETAAGDPPAGIE